MSNFKQKVKHELHELLPVTIFFVLSFLLLAFTQALILKKYNIGFTSFATAVVLGLLVAKVVVITDHILVDNRFPNKPLIYNIIWKTIIYFIISFLFRYLEHLIPAWIKSAGFGVGNREIFKEVIWPQFWGVQLWQFILLFAYCIFSELIRILGKEKILEVLFKRPIKLINNEK